MNYRELKAFANDVAVPRLQEVLNNTQIPEGLLCIDSLSVAFLDGRSCGADYHIKASGYVYHDGVIDEYVFDEADVPVSEFVDKHKGFVFISEGSFYVEDEINEAKAETTIGNALFFAPVFHELEALCSMNVKWNYLPYVKMEALFQGQTADFVQSVDSRISEAMEKTEGQEAGVCRDIEKLL